MLKIEAIAQGATVCNFSLATVSIEPCLKKVRAECNKFNDYHLKAVSGRTVIMRVFLWERSNASRNTRII